MKTKKIGIALVILAIILAVWGTKALYFKSVEVIPENKLIKIDETGKNTDTFEDMTVYSFKFEIGDRTYDFNRQGKDRTEALQNVKEDMERVIKQIDDELQ